MEDLLKASKAKGDKGKGDYMNLLSALGRWDELYSFFEATGERHLAAALLLAQGKYQELAVYLAREPMERTFRIMFQVQFSQRSC